nr:MAG TPA: hypothetical protein [Caudoviricetes sp.]
MPDDGQNGGLNDAVNRENHKIFVPKGGTKHKNGCSPHRSVLSFSAK